MAGSEDLKQKAIYKYLYMMITVRLYFIIEYGRMPYGTALKAG